ncbi:hypothetical protein A7K93_02290 [Candidatus Methylacidiphilum fumarolicum]|nr:hypothetical protein A7K73_00915 [Candidatus Methylacidiphilum fumarolicum]TFE73554.1 hypothetical protein A7K72_06555 [Candidatus Methylacidiphilum fumarolicum]TFE74985.1 hypothetical protein A7K93_02290 [Candidatus Methylacidiphilum fumarolicum]TFE76528.1 hypothetical protein A7D33_09295 [Candidatus Methylacidiphilum fumarolicum]
MRKPQWCNGEVDQDHCLGIGRKIFHFHSIGKSPNYHFLVYLQIAHRSFEEVLWGRVHFLEPKLLSPHRERRTTYGSTTYRGETLRCRFVE